MLDYQVEVILFGINWCGVLSAYVCCVRRKYLSVFIYHIHFQLKLKYNILWIITYYDMHFLLWMHVASISLTSIILQDRLISHELCHHLQEFIVILITIRCIWNRRAPISTKALHSGAEYNFAYIFSSTFLCFSFL